VETPRPKYGQGNGKIKNTPIAMCSNQKEMPIVMGKNKIKYANCDVQHFIPKETRSVGAVRFSYLRALWFY